MASHVVVIDTSFRRATIKVTPGKYMTDVLDEACNKFGLKASNYGLKNNNKPVDTSRTFRQTGLVSGAKLELVIASRSPSVVSVALQLPQSLAAAVPGGRLTDKVPSDTTLWLILRKFETSGGANLNFTARGVAQTENGKTGPGRVVYEMPILNIMGRELSTFGDLQKTLAQLGLNAGSSLIRLDFKTTEQPIEEAMADIGQYFKTEEGPTESGKPGPQTESEPAAPAEADIVTDAFGELPSTAQAGDGDVQMSNQGGADGIPTSDPSTATSKRPASNSPEEEILGPNQRPMAVFSAPMSDTPKAALQPHNDNDYEPTIAHAKLHQSRLQNNTQNKRLLSDAETERLEMEKAAKLATTKEVSIKIRFPDQSTIVSPFTVDETALHLYKYVSEVIVAEDQPFKLVWTSKGTQTVPKDDTKKLIKDLGFEGRMLLNFHWEDGASDIVRKGPVLKPKFAQSAKELSIPDIAAVEAKEEAGPSIDSAKSNEAAPAGGKRKGGVPKWMKGLSKK